MSGQNDIDYQPLEAMKGVGKQVARQFLNARTSLLIAIAVVNLIAMVVLIVLAPNSGLPALPGVIFFIDFIVLGIAYGKALHRDEDAIWEAFAAANGWPVDTTTSAQHFIPGSIEDGTNHTFSPIIRAEFDGTIAYIFTYNTIVGSGKSAVTYLYTLAVAGVGKQLPHILLDNKKGVNLLITRFQNHEILKLEGDFNDYFTLQIEKGQEIDALTILTPDVMQVLIDDNNSESIELIRNDICFIAGGHRLGAEDMRALINSVAKLYPQIVENIAGVLEPAS